MPKRNQHDPSPGDARAPFSDQGGPEGRHAQTHDVRREEITNPTGPAPRTEDTIAADIAPDTSTARPGGHAAESHAADADKALHDRLPELSNDELARLRIVADGVRLDQGGVYIDLDHPERGPFKALGSETAGPGHRYVAKRDTDYELWNTLVPSDAEPHIDRPPSATGGR
jgi:hypothetical protein